MHHSSRWPSEKLPAAALLKGNFCRLSNDAAIHQPLLVDFLEHCDLAKFARWQLSVPQMEAMHQSACTFVIETGKPTAPVAVESAVAEPQPTLMERKWS